MVIKDADGNIISKDRFNKDGTYMLFFTNGVLSPDANAENIASEMELLMTHCY